MMKTTPWGLQKCTLEISNFSIIHSIKSIWRMFSDVYSHQLSCITPLRRSSSWTLNKYSGSGYPKLWKQRGEENVLLLERWRSIFNESTTPCYRINKCENCGLKKLSIFNPVKPKPLNNCQALILWIWSFTLLYWTLWQI